MVSVYPVYNRVLLVGVFILLAFLAIGTICLPNLILVISLFFALYILIFTKPLTGLALVSLSAFLANIVITVNSSVRTANEIVHFTTIPVILIYIILLPKIVQNLKFSNRYEKTIMSLLLFLFGWAVISFFWTYDVYHGMNVLSTFLVSVFVVQTTLLLIEDKDALYKILNILVIIGVALGILLLASRWYTGGKQIEIIKDVSLSISLLTDKKRPGGFAPPDIAASVMSIFVFVSIALMYRANLIKRVAMGLVILFLIYCNLLTASKAGAGSLFIGLALLVFIMPFFRNFVIRLSIALLSLISLIALIGGGVLLKRLQLLLEKSAERGFLSDRMGWWTIGFDKLWDTYGIGLGAGGFLKFIDPVPGTHNFYFSVLFDLGVVGFSIFILIIIVLINYIRRILKVCKDKEMIFFVYCFIASLVTFGIQALVEGDFQQIFFWLLLALMLTVLKVAARTREEIICN